MGANRVARVGANAANDRQIVIGAQLFIMEHADIRECPAARYFVGTATYSV
jgi:hypothetical protein